MKDIVATQAYIPEICNRTKPLKRVICSCCGAHLGQVYDDGPYPFYKRFTVNCSSLNFHQKPLFPRPPEPQLLEKLYKKEIKNINERKNAINTKVRKMFNKVKDRKSVV